MTFSSSVPGEGLISSATKRLSAAYNNHRRHRSNTRGSGHGDTVVDAYHSAYPSARHSPPNGALPPPIHTGPFAGPNHYNQQQQHHHHHNGSTGTLGKQRHIHMGVDHSYHSSPVHTGSNASPYGASPLDPSPIPVPGMAPNGHGGGMAVPHAHHGHGASTSAYPLPYDDLQGNGYGGNPAPFGSSVPTSLDYEGVPVKRHTSAHIAAQGQNAGTPNRHGYHHQKNKSLGPMAGFPSVPVATTTLISHGAGLGASASSGGPPYTGNGHGHPAANGGGVNGSGHRRGGSYSAGVSHSPDTGPSGLMGNGHHSPPGNSPSSDRQQLLKWFRSVDKDHDGHLTAEELQSVLLNGDWSKFNLETVHLLMSLFDQDSSGTITFPEFENLWHYITEWRTCFAKFDDDQSGTIRPSQFKRALKAFGYGLDDELVTLTIHRFDRGRVHTHPSHHRISIDNFIQACVTIKGVSDAFQHLRPDAEGTVRVTYPQLIRLAMHDSSLYSRRH